MVELLTRKVPQAKIPPSYPYMFSMQNEVLQDFVDISPYSCLLYFC